MTGSQGTSRAVARRTVVAAAGGAGLAAALTACGGSDSPAASAGDAPAGGGTAGGSTGGTGGAATGGGGAGGQVIARTADIPEGGGKVVGNVVVTQPKAGEFKAFSSKCTHAGCAVKDVADGVINCPCHGSKFDAADGSVKAGPATMPLAAAPITVEGDSIRLA
ncbi:Rieske (2Fe-2S) protein [Streptomyces sp. WAC05374]|uniref:Rieske (2Fe-2S) protein n=2 Tax=Streptomyces sp. WAC05374 TaxID=2487420 RepID=UPI001054C114|nr:Rieske (2Fe-2S) protein [Streptomyces sp. WAC05374]TDF50794.1 Rieske (2Fe-2S) protein [Streptomyces sp. WAC05374]TDF57084.1 Rieske (2Fe-2S) protein [Streptomyces sp. WAC05374]TDF61045.1 Rieske (2Fe-2S) protein [Streptomyces sp. WAC05374]